MFRGAHSLNLDTKGRLAVPSRHQSAIDQRCGGSMVVTVAATSTQERCLWLYPLDEWERVEAKIVALPSFDPNHQQLKRFLLGHASEVDMDGSGRLLLPAVLRDFAMLDKAVMLVGQGNKFELWSAELWAAKCAQWLQETMDSERLSVEMEQLAL